MVCLGVAHGPPPVISSGDQRSLACNAKGESSLLPRRNQLGDRLTVAGNHDGFAFLDQFEQLGEPGFGFVDIDLHKIILVQSFS